MIGVRKRSELRDSICIERGEPGEAAAAVTPAELEGGGRGR